MNKKIFKTSLDKKGNIVLYYLNNKNEIKKKVHNFSKQLPLKYPYYSSELNNFDDYYEKYYKFNENETIGGNMELNNNYNFETIKKENWSKSNYDYEKLFKEPEYNINLDKIDTLDYNEICFKY
jgi:hypothetical protein